MQSFLNSSTRIFEQYKLLAEKAMQQVDEPDLFLQETEDENSIAIIVQHLSGNMLSRWTDFLTSDGEKDWRNRDQEFETFVHSKEELFAIWEKGWTVFLTTLHSLKETDMEKTVFIRHEPHSVMEAMNRQMAHYSYHIGQMVLLCKKHVKTPWNSLSIPKNGSQIFNAEKMKKP